MKNSQKRGHERSGDGEETQRRGRKQEGGKEKGKWGLRSEHKQGRNEERWGKRRGVTGGFFGCKTPSSIFNSVESLQMMGERKREEGGGGRGREGEERGGRRGGVRERVGSCSRVKGCHGDSTAETGTVRLVGGKKHARGKG